MKKILSSLLLLFQYPFMLLKKTLKKTNIDNFVGGLIFGALFSLVVNILTVQFQEMLDKQRTLEAIENEIVGNVIKANGVIEQNNKNRDNKELINYFYTTPVYSQNFWSQSSEAVKYISQMDHEVQSEIILYYTFSVNSALSLEQRADYLLNRYLDYCYGSNFVVPKEMEDECYVLSYAIYSAEDLAATQLADNGLSLLNKFHPTKDRLNNFFLRTVMGNKSTIILGLEK